MRLKDKVALITGAGGGIGEATAVMFAKQGAKIGVQDISEEGAARVVAAIVDAGGEAIAVIGDVTDKAACEQMVKAVVA